MYIDNAYVKNPADHPRPLHVYKQQPCSHVMNMQLLACSKFVCRIVSLHACVYCLSCDWFVYNADNYIHYK